jgi:hypothetical protein
MDRSIWHLTLDPDARTLRWPCPFCQQVTLAADKSTLHALEGKDSDNAKDHPDWEPEWSDFRFACLLRCACGETVAAVGKQGLTQEFVYDSNRQPVIEYLPRFEPLYFHPPLPIIAVPKGTPDAVAEQISRSFRSYWDDLESCANSLRSATEKLLDHVTIPQTAPDKNGTVRRLSLAQRLAVFGQNEQQLSATLSAVRVLGNVGSHSGELTREDLLDAYEIIEHALEEIILKKSKRLAQIATEITHRNKPRSQT